MRDEIMTARAQTPDVRQTDVSPEKMPGHWLLARMGKRVLRPGGMELTRRLLQSLEIQPHDDVVEFAPGMGITARLTLERNPASYTAIERDENVAASVRSYLNGANRRCIVGDASETGLEPACASVVYGEAMLSMQLPQVKSRIVREAHRLLRSGGRYGIHEMCLVPDDLDEDTGTAIQRELSDQIHVGVRPLTAAEWRKLLEDEGFLVESVGTAPMHLLEPQRLIKDEGLAGAIRFALNIARHPAARHRVLGMRRIFRKWKGHLAAIMLVARKS
jgi:phospholipid N-methyltransferase